MHDSIAATLVGMERLKVDLETATKALQGQAQQVFADGCKAIFDIFPDLKSFAWRQYTPYFNDGDACEFGVQREPDINGVSASDISEEWTWNSYGKATVYPACNPELIPLKDAVTEFLEAIPDTVFQTVFGDHVEVTVTRDGATVSKYEHD